MFFGSPSLDLKITLFLTVLVVFLALMVFIFSKKKMLSIFLLSVLANLVFFVQSALGSLIFKIYDLIWLQIFSVTYWPIINLILFFVLIFIYFKDVKKKKE